MRQKGKEWDYKVRTHHSGKRQPIRPLPCPFCRGRHEIVYQDRLADDTQGNDISCIICETCGAWGPWVTGGYSNAIRFWNLRNANLEDLSEKRRIKAPHLEPETQSAEKITDAKQCPFCKGKNLSMGNSGDEEEPYWYVTCLNCGTCRPSPEIDEESTREQAVREWNGELISLFRHQHGDGSEERTK